jgi:uncharacterized RDD family membrane protein YckC
MFDATTRWNQALERKGASLGGWIVLLRATVPILADHPHDPVAHALRATISDMVRCLEEFVTIRNTYAHGGKPRTHAEQNAAAKELTTRASAVLARAEPLTNLRLGVVRRCVQGPDRRTRIDLDVLAGFAELFSRKVLRSPRRFDEGTVLAYVTDSLEQAVDLTPYCAWRPCPTCGRDELFYLTKAKGGRGDHYSFATGHRLKFSENVVVTPPERVARMGMTSLGSRRSAAADRWRGVWPDLASRHRRLAARAVDTLLVAAVGTIGWLCGMLLGLPIPWIVVLAVVVAAACEPALALAGGTPGKRLLRIEAISTWDCRPLAVSDMLRRAVVADLQLIPPVAIYNLAWLLWDPARQCLHDRIAASIVVAGRSPPAQKR